MSFEAHRKALQKFLDQAYVNPSITVENFDDMFSNIVVQAFDGTRREVLGDIVLQLEIRLSKFIGAVPYTLHQKLKYINAGQVITVKGEEDLLVEVADQALNTSFQTLELEYENINQKVTHMMMKNGFQLGKGLGANLQGISAPISLLENVGKQGLGYSLSKGPKENNRPTRDGIPHLCQTFTISSDIMVSLEDKVPMPMVDMGAGSNPWIHLCMKDEKLDNWEIESLQDLIHLE
ncbi:hypothetical protein L6164_001218 [Bauhinia variegata]|uniref:Uncharacterized protein n=1 Tax=Bauhinia variegata TaxID=167791 RepID=A0ACB9QB25_BAUVA|nr:hypothetical protein L6164_001218 [Bauhinia variegata]